LTLIENILGLPFLAIEDWRERFRTFSVKINLRMTGQGLAIFKTVFKESSHFTAEKLLNKAQLIDRTVCRASVYRILPILSESSLVR